MKNSWEFTFTNVFNLLKLEVLFIFKDKQGISL